MVMCRLRAAFELAPMMQECALHEDMIRHFSHHLCNNVYSQRTCGSVQRPQRHILSAIALILGLVRLKRQGPSDNSAQASSQLSATSYYICSGQAAAQQIIGQWATLMFGFTLAGRLLFSRKISLTRLCPDSSG
jgi:hypothetical protein